MTLELIKSMFLYISVTKDPFPFGQIFVTLLGESFEPRWLWPTSIQRLGLLAL